MRFPSTSLKSANGLAIDKNVEAPVRAPGYNFVDAPPVLAKCFMSYYEDISCYSTELLKLRSHFWNVSLFPWQIWFPFYRWFDFWFFGFLFRTNPQSPAGPDSYCREQSSGTVLYIICTYGSRVWNGYGRVRSNVNASYLLVWYRIVTQEVKGRP